LRAEAHLEDVRPPVLGDRQAEPLRGAEEELADRGGVAEHGVGRLKRAELARRKPALDLDLMRALKGLLDPKGILNPGAVI
jgi:FAD/FMN-containing dehydrogenase